MKNEKQADFYNSAFKRRTVYKNHYNDFPLRNVYMTAMAMIEGGKILDAGCGCGQFANMLFDNGFTDYLGFDFSDEAIKIAKSMNHEYKDKFIVSDIYKIRNITTLFNPRTIIFMEVLEHIDDLKVLKMLKGFPCTMIISVPKRDSVAHLRYFKSEGDVIKHYSEYVISDIHSIDNWYLFSIVTL